MAEKLTFGGVLDLETRAAAARLKAIEGQARDSFRNIKVDFNSAPLKAGSAALGRIRRDADQFEKSMEAANARVLAFGTAVGVIEGMRRSFLALIKTTADVETALTKISIVAGSDLEKTGTTIEKVGKQIFNVAKQTGQTFAVASEAYLELSRQGLGLSQSLERTKVSLDVVRASGAEHSKVISGLTAAYNAFSDTGLTYTQIAEKIANVDAKTTTSYEGLLDVLSRASSTARQTGTSFEELLAVTSTLKDLTARSESVIGNAFRSISTRLLDPKILENLQSLYNIDTRALDTGALLKPVEILTNVSNKLKEISDPSQRNEIVKSISGLYQADQLNALIKALSDASNLQGIYQKNLRASTEESDVLARSSQKFADTLNNQFAVLGVQLTEILNSFGKLGLAQPLSSLLKTISGLAENLKGAAENTDFLSQGFQFVAKILGGAIFSKAGLVAIGVIIGKIAKDFVAFGLEAGRSFLGLNKAARDQAAIQQSIAAYIQQSGQNLNVLLSSEQARLNLTKQIAAAWNQSVLSAQQMAAVTKQIAVPIFNSGLRAGPTGPSRRAADGFVPLVNAEMNDVKRGVGGANPNSKIVVMPNFPFGGGKRGMMVANSSETLVDYGGGKYGIMNPDMMAGRAASGFLKGQKPQTVSGKFAPVGNLESGLEALVSLYVEAGKSAKEISGYAKIVAQSFNLNEKSLDLVVSATEKYAVSLKQTAVRLEQEAIAESRRIALGKADQIIRSTPEKRAAFLDAPILPTASGKFIERPSPKAIERALKESSEILTKEIADAAYQEIYNGILRKRQEILEYVKNNPPNPLAFGAPSRTVLSGIETSSGVPRYDSSGKRVSSQMGNVIAGQPNYFGNPTFSYLNQPIRNPLSPQSADPLTRAQEIGRLRELERIKNQPRGLSNASSILAAQEDAAFRQRIKESTSRSNSLAAFGAAQRISAEKEFLQSNAPKGFDPEAFNKFAAKSFVAIATLEGFSSAVRGTSQGLDTLLGVANKLTFAFTGIAALQQFGGINVTNLSDKVLGLFGKGGGIFSKIGGFLAPLVRSLPVIGQLGIALTAVNYLFKDLTGTSIVEKFTGMSESAERAKDKFNEIAQQLFDPSTGKYVGRGLSERQTSLSQTREDAIQRLNAKARGIDVSGKNAQEISTANFGKFLSESVSGVETGNVKTRAARVGGIVGELKSEAERTYRETISNLTPAAQDTIIEALKDVVGGTLEELRGLASQKGIKSIGGIKVENADAETLQKSLARAFLEQFIREQKLRIGGAIDLESVLSGERGRARISGAGFRFSKINPTEQAVIGTNNKPVNPKDLISARVGQERIQNLVDIKTLQQDILSFEELSLQTLVRTGELNDLEIAKLEAKQRLLENEREERQRIVDLIGRSVSTFGKEDLKKGIEASKVDSLESRIKQFNGDAEQARSIVAEIGELFVPEKAKELTQIFESEVKRLEEQKKIRQQILQQTNDQSIKEAEILQRLERQRGILQSGFEARESGRELFRTGLEGRVSLLEARASRVNIGTASSEAMRREAIGLRQQAIQSSIQGIEDEYTKLLSESFSKAVSEGLSGKEIENELSVLENQKAQRIQQLKDESAALEENSRQIGQTANSLVEFGNSILEFERSLGSNRAQNQFNLLQATDKSSIVGGLISEGVFDDSAGKSGEELVKFISEQNALRQQQFDIATAASKVEKLNLETELELTQQILSIKNSDLSVSEKQLAIESAINNNLEKRRSFGFGVQEALGGMQDEVNNFGNTFGKTATEGFRDGLVSAMQAAVSQTDNLKDALLDVALTFANKLRDAALTNLANIITSGSRSGQGSGGFGGIVSSILGAFTGNRYATGGKVTGGSGTKDDVPTLLMGGEYVINKKSVQKYGQSFFESLNRGSVGQMAQGGYFAPGVRGQGNITGKENLLDFATQTATFGGQDIRRSLKGGAGMVSLEPESLRLSNFARFGDSPIVQATQEAKEQAFGLYIDQLGQEKQYQEELANYYRELEEAQSAKKKAEKDKKKQFLISLATAAVSAGLSYGFGGGAKTGAKAGGTRFSGGRIRGVSERPFGSSSSRNLPAGYSSAARYSSTANEFQSFPTQFEPDIPLSPLSNFSNYGGPQLLPPLSFDWRNWMMGITSSLANGGPKIAQPIQANLRQKTIFPYSNSFYNSYVRRNSGGAISGSGDSVPVMASKGEFMLNSSAAKKIGYSNLYAMNNGAIPSGSSDNSAIVVAKLDELIEKTVGASNVTVNVTISKDGETSSSQEGGDQNNKQLAEKLRGAVVQIMQAEQRPGGVLSKR